jgi:hypothetical protein
MRFLFTLIETTISELKYFEIEIIISEKKVNLESNQEDNFEFQDNQIYISLRNECVND